MGKAGKSFAAGGIAGLIKLSAVMPLDTIKVTMQLNKHEQRGVLRTALQICRSEAGVFGLYYGFSAAALIHTRRCALVAEPVGGDGQRSERAQLDQLGQAARRVRRELVVGEVQRDERGAERERASVAAPKVQRCRTLKGSKEFGN